MLVVLKRLAFAVYAADAAILTALVHENVITNIQSLDIATIIAALAAGLHGGIAIQAKATNTPSVVNTPNPKDT